MNTGQMRAVLLIGHGGLEQLHYRDDVPIPAIKAGQALIRVKACGLNNTDINTRTAWYSKKVRQGITEEAVQSGYETFTSHDASWGNASFTFPLIQGADVCGIVEQVCDPRDRQLVGQRVLIDPWLLDSRDPRDLSKARYLGSEVDGGYADYTVVPVENIHCIETDYSDEQLATFGCAYSTAENLIGRASLSGGETIVISGASGGVGSAAVQLSKIREARVIALSTTGKEKTLLDLGADHVLNRKEPHLIETIKECAGGHVDVVADVVGGELFEPLTDCLKPGGRYSSSGCIAGSMVNFDLRKLIYRDLQFTGATVVPPTTFVRLVEHIEQRQIKPLLAETFPLSELARAQTCFMKKQHVGNIVVSMA